MENTCARKKHRSALDGHMASKNKPFFSIWFISHSNFKYFFVVIPLYQKQVLDELIARKEVELKQINTSLEKSYSELRSYYMSGFIREASMKCTGIDVMTEESRGLETPIALTVKISECLIKPLNNSKNIKRLRQKDIETINSEVSALGKNLEIEQASAFETYKGIPSKAKTDKSILLPPDPNGFSGRLLEFLLRHGSRPKSELDDYRTEISIQTTQEKVAHDYTGLVMDKIGKLHEIKW
jgi:hypothetical protein